MNEIIKKIETLTYGHNYQTTFGFDDLGYCSDLKQLQEQFKKIYPDSTPNYYEFIKLDFKIIKEEIDFGFNYRGDSGSGLKLSNDKEKELNILVNQYKNYIFDFIKSYSEIYYYPNCKGLKGYPIFWGYQFIIFNKMCEKSYFIYGYGSD